MKSGLLVFHSYIASIGGIETFLYEFFKRYSDEYDILFVYKSGDYNQIKRYSKFVRCVKYKNIIYECDVYLNCSVMDNIQDNVIAKRVYCMNHADLNAINVPMKQMRYIDKMIAVSKLSAISTSKYIDAPVEVIYNPLTLDEKIKKPINIISATRLQKEKGLDNMYAFADYLTKNDIRFNWICFTNNKTGEDHGILFRTPVLNIKDYLLGFDYYFDGSYTESYGYSIVEALSYDIPILTFEKPILNEIGFFDGKNGYLLKKDRSNWNDVIKNIYNIPKNFNYHKLDDYESWKKIIGKIKRYSNYKEELKMRYLVKALNTYKEQNLLDNELGFIPEEGYEWEVSKERLDVLLGENGFGMKFVELVKEINLEEQENQTSNEETKEIEPEQENQTSSDETKEIEENKEIETATLKDKRNPRK